MGSVTLTTKVLPKPGVSYRVLDGRAVLVDVVGGHYFGLDEVGTCIWELIQSRGDLSEVLEMVLTEFDTTREVARADVLRLVDELIRQGLIETLPSDP